MTRVTASLLRMARNWPDPISIPGVLPKQEFIQIRQVHDKPRKLNFIAAILYQSIKTL